MLTWDSLAERPVPSWYEDAKLGVMIHWGPYAVRTQEPASAETLEVITRHWGRRGHYDALIRTFRQVLRDMDPADMLGAVAASGARYLVVSAKHHDGFALWPARAKNPRKRGWQVVTRDVVGELAEGARALGLKFGLYDSAGLDATFGDIPDNGLADLAGAIPRSRSYTAYVDAQWRELITRYSPSILWNDVGSPASEDLPALFSEYYAAPDGVVNDRFGQPEGKDSRGEGLQVLTGHLDLFKPRSVQLPSLIAEPLPVRHADFHTVEFGGSATGAAGPWECVRTLAENDDAEATVPGLVDNSATSPRGEGGSFSASFPVRTAR